MALLRTNIYDHSRQEILAGIIENLLNILIKENNFIIRIPFVIPLIIEYFFSGVKDESFYYTINKILCSKPNFMIFVKNGFFKIMLHHIEKNENFEINENYLINSINFGISLYDFNNLLLKIQEFSEEKKLKLLSFLNS